MNNLSNVNYISDVSGLALSESKLLLNLYKGPTFFNFLDGQDFNELLNNKFITPSDDKFMLSEDGMQIILDAVSKYGDELPKNEKANRARGIRDDMTQHKEYIESIISIELKPITVDRSNYIIGFKKRTNGVRWVEVRNNNLFRLSGYKMEQSLIDELEKLGVTYRQVGPVTWLDIDCTSENIHMVLNHLNFVN